MLNLLRAHFNQLSLPARWSVCLVAVFSVLHLLIASRVQMGADEAHYALYALHLDWSYFDHPPLVGWLQSLVLILGEQDFLFRLIPSLLFCVTCYLLYQLSWQLYGERYSNLPFVTLLLFNAAIILQLIGMTMVPDTPLLTLSLLVMRQLQRLMQLQRWRDWLLLGAYLGLAGLAKYTAITLVVSCLLWVLLQRRWTLLWRMEFVALVVVASVLISPVLFWNWQHDWLSFRYQFAHGTGAGEWQWSQFFAAQASQLAVYSPLVYIGGLLALIVFVKDREKSAADIFLLCFSLPVLLLFAWTSGYEMSLPHWPALAWMLLLPLLAKLILQTWQRLLTKVLVATAGSVAVVSLLLIFSLLIYPWYGFRDYRHPLQDLLGWDAAAKRAHELAAAHDGDILVSNWSFASRVAWYARPSKVIVLDQRYDQFDLWYGSPNPGMNGLLLLASYKEQSVSKDLARFQRCEFLEAMPIRAADHMVVRFEYYWCEHWHE